MSFPLLQEDEDEENCLQELNSNDALDVFNHSSYDNDSGVGIDSATSSFNISTYVPTPCFGDKSTVKKASASYTNTVQAYFPESKSSDIANPLLFSCEVTCTHFVTFALDQPSSEAKPIKRFDLDKLDVLLNSTSTLSIQCEFLLNGLDHLLEYPSWIRTPLDKIMQQCGFVHPGASSSTDDSYSYRAPKAFVTTPLSYLFNKQAPHGTLDKLDIVFDYRSSKSKEFQSTWNRRLTLESMSSYMEYALATIILRKTCYMYPFIFSGAYTHRLTQHLSYLPYIAQSLQNIYKTSRSTMSVSNHAFSQDVEDKLEIMQNNFSIMSPSTANKSSSISSSKSTNSSIAEDKETMIPEDEVVERLILGMYYCIKMDNKPKQPISRSSSAIKIDPPNALCSIARLWSVTCSTGAEDDDGFI